MNTDTLDLKLTDEEFEVAMCEGLIEREAHFARAVASAATAKAAWAIVGWLRADKWAHIRKQPTYDYMMHDLEQTILDAGIQKPKGD